MRGLESIILLGRFFKRHAVIPMRNGRTSDVIVRRYARCSHEHKPRRLTLQHDRSLCSTPSRLRSPLLLTRQPKQTTLHSRNCVTYGNQLLHASFARRVNRLCWRPSSTWSGHGQRQGQQRRLRGSKRPSDLAVLPGGGKEQVCTWCATWTVGAHATCRSRCRALSIAAQRPRAFCQ